MFNNIIHNRRKKAANKLLRQAALHLRAIKMRNDGASYAQIAEELHLPESTVRNIINK